MISKPKLHPFDQSSFPASLIRLDALLFGILISIFPCVPAVGSPRSSLPRIQPSKEGTHFTAGKDGPRFVVWGVNYDRDDSGRLLESYWDKDWELVVGDFHEMRDLGVNLVRIHLQTASFMTDSKTPNQANLSRLEKLLKLAESCGLYLDITGLGCYVKEEVPAWYDVMAEAQRWEVQAVFWHAVAKACHGSSAVFCYDLMNEPIVSGGPQAKDWLPGEPLGGKHYAQRITLDAKDRSEKEIATLWVKKMTAAIREADPHAMITVGVIAWSQVFPGALPVFYAPEAASSLDFTSIHLYPRSGKLKEDLAAMMVHEIGKPLVIEEIFPLSSTPVETETFIRESKSHVDGWVSFYWGRTAKEYAESDTITSALMGDWLERFGDLGPELKQPGLTAEP